MRFFEEIKDRKIRRYLGLYISACITIIGLTHLFSLRYNLPIFIFDTLLVLVISGIFTVTLIAWNHGKEGHQKIKWWEYPFHTLIVIIASLVIYFQVTENPINILPLNSKTIAVLPFTNMSEAKEDEYFSDGITEDILTQLSKISKFKVISRTTMKKYKSTEQSIIDIGQELGAGSILEGSVRRYENKVRITAQLINSSRDEHIWAETFDRNINDIFEVQSEIAKHIANQLEAKLAPKEEILIDSKPTHNIDAYAFYLKGREFASSYTDEGNERSIDLYKKALDIDSNYALAYAGLASSYDQKVRRYFYGVEWQDSAMEMSRKALSINPNLAEGHSSLAKSYEAKGLYNLAKYHYEEAIRLNPNYYAAIYNLGVVYFNEENLDRAYKLIKQSIQLEPDNVFGYIVLGNIYWKLDCNKLALEYYEKSLELEPENLLANLYVSEHYLTINDIENAEEALSRLFKINSNWPYGKVQLAKLYLLKKEYKKSEKLFENLNDIMPYREKYDYAFVLMQNKTNKRVDEILLTETNKYLEEIEQAPEQSFQSELNLAIVYALQNENDKALFRLKKSIEKGYVDYKKILSMPYMDRLKTDNRFKEHINRMQAKIDSMKSIAQSEDIDWIFCR